MAHEVVKVAKTIADRTSFKKLFQEKYAGFTSTDLLGSSIEFLSTWGFLASLERHWRQSSHERVREVEAGKTLIGF